MLRTFPRETISDYLKGLEAAGILKSAQDEAGNLQFSLIKDYGVHAPRVRKDGSEVLQGRATESMWSAMRFLSSLPPANWQSMPPRMSIPSLLFTP